MKYAIFVDVDGTLLDNKQQIPESAVYVIQNARKNGHYVFLNTGRCKAELFESILDVGFDGIIYSSGGYIEYEGQCIRHLTFDENDIQSLIQYFEKNKIGYYLECNHGMYVDTLYQDWMQEVFKDFMPEGAEYACLDGYFYPNYIGTDFYHHYKEDIALFAQMGFKMFRMSISWPRIYPNGNDEKPNQEGLDFYRSVFEELHKYGIEPLVTISHYDDPLYMEEKLGGWQNRETNGLYEKYCHSIFEEYKDLVKYWRH